MNITDFMREELLFLDGGMGTLLQAEGLAPGELPERWSITHPDKIRAIHRAYFDAKCDNETLIKAIRKDAPEAFIGIGLVPTPAGQDAWGKGYGCKNNSFQFMKNRWKLNQLYMKKVEIYI